MERLAHACHANTSAYRRHLTGARQNPTAVPLPLAIQRRRAIPPRAPSGVRVHDVNTLQSRAIRIRRIMRDKAVNAAGRRRSAANLA